MCEEYKADNNITVTVEWAQQEGITFSARVSPSASLIIDGSTRCQLTISYNTEYNFSVVAVTACGNTTASITLIINYGEMHQLAYTVLSVIIAIL